MWVDSKRFNELKDKATKYEELQKKIDDASNWDIPTINNQYVILSWCQYQVLLDYKESVKESSNITNENNRLKETNATLTAELEKYKRMYVDEFQKRLEMAKLLKENEDENHYRN